VRFASLEIHKEEFAFSAGHFTIFSATEREQLHGHNYYVSMALHFGLNPEGLSFDYRYYKKKMRTICDQLDRHFLLPTKSPFLQIEERDDYLYAEFNQKKIPFLKDDVVLIPVTNVTIEELSHWFLQHLVADQADLDRHAITGVEIKVYNGPGQSAGAVWNRPQSS
jgi:6-pyruvoyltetrahydropterin/6-carboxytetrahydropterin synthase